jgi:alanyl-tRNA synthetase
MTKKLYWADARQTTFRARIVALDQQDGKTLVTLDQTAFYPESGGQPCDAGTLDGAAVESVSITDDGRILHTLAGAAALSVGEEVRGEIDWTRRRELTQQHTGQHILSQAFFQLFGAETKGFRILDDVTQIDLTLEADNAAVPLTLLRAEDLANQIVFENRAIRMHEVTPEEAAKLPLRKESFVSDCVRIVEIEDFDWSPCGGTHAQRTGEVGLIALRNWERAKQMVRVEFVCGGRALRDYREANQITRELARGFTIGRSEIPTAVARVQEESKQWQRRARALAQVAAQVEAAALWEAAPEQNGCRIITRLFTDRDFEEAKLIAHRLVERPRTIALLAVQEATAARLVFARSSDEAPDRLVDMNALMKAACERLQGRGGGKPDFAQGGGSLVKEVAAVLDEIEAKL